MAKDGDKAKAQANAADTREDFTPQATSRETGKNSRGEPTIYPSDVEAVATQYNLTTTEAERLILEGDLSESAADAIKGERVVYRPHMEFVASPDSHPLTLADRRQADTDAAEERRKEQADEIAVDPTAPTSGPYGPNATYSEVEAPVDKDHAPVVVETTTRVVGEEA